MPSATSCDKAQPWKAHWPPAEAKATEGVEYGVKKGEVVVVDGTSAKVSVAKERSGAAIDKQA
jgi:hypothetical protein